MFETGIRQFRMAMAMVNGRRIKPHLIQRLVADADATLREFGSPGDDVNQLLDGPFADPEPRTHFQNSRAYDAPPGAWPLDHRSTRRGSRVSGSIRTRSRSGR